MQLLAEKTLEQRLDILLNKVKGLAEDAYRQQVGKSVQVLLESEHKGRSSDNFWIQTKKSYTIGSILESEVIQAEGTLLFTRD